MRNGSYSLSKIDLVNAFAICCVVRSIDLAESIPNE